MKVGFLFTDGFWGLFLIFLGITIILKAVFKIEIPIFRVALSFFLIYMGVSLLFGGGFGNFKHNNTIMFGEQKIETDAPASKYDIIFSSGTIDLTKVPITDKVIRVEINTIFGSGVIKVNPDTPVVIRGDSVFASTRLPNGNQTNFGGYNYQTSNVSEGSGHLEIEADVVFGSLEIRN